MFEKGSLMVYDTAGVCRVEDIGVPEGLPAAREGREYYKLSPVFGSGIIYIPVDTKVFMRPVISRQEAQEILEGAGLGGVGIPRMVNERTLGGEAYV